MEKKLGIKTTEFWLALLVTVAGAVATVYSTEPWAQVAGVVAASLASAGYSFARAVTKASGGGR